jgi:mono/diheme cytochrome c family protein
MSSKISLVLIAFSFLALSAFNLSHSTNETEGKKLYETYCISCHMQDGNGIAGAFPPLKGVDYLMKDRGRLVRAIKNGVSGELEVNGTTYYGEMPGFDLTEEEILNLSNYVLTSWGNNGEKINKEFVKKALATKK